jgi:ferredoxin
MLRAMTELHVRVLPNCCGYTLCVDICPEVFQLDDAGFAVAAAGPIDETLHAKVAEACESCPQDAIETQHSPFS